MFSANNSNINSAFDSHKIEKGVIPNLFLNIIMYYGVYYYPSISVYKIYFYVLIDLPNTKFHKVKFLKSIFLL